MRLTRLLVLVVLLGILPKAAAQTFTYPNAYSLLNPFDSRIKYTYFAALVTAGDVEIARLLVPSIFQTSITLVFPPQAVAAVVAKVRTGFVQVGTTAGIADLAGAYTTTYTLPTPFAIPAGAVTTVVYTPIFATVTATVTPPLSPPPPVADTTPPTVSITAPGAGATVVGTNSLTAIASDNVGVVGVQFGIDSANYGAEITAPPYTTVWNSTTVADGAHTINAVARDAAGNRASSAVITVKVSNAPPPPPPPPPPVGISPDGSKITPASGGSLTTAAGIWTFGTGTGAGGNVILLNGAPALSGEATELYVLNVGNLYAFNSFSNWYQWTGGWTRLSAAPPGAPHP